MDNFFYTLKIIYTNRFRQLTFKDSSAFWLPFLAYFLIIFKLINGSFPSFPTLDIKPYFVLIISLYICLLANQRSDWNLLNSLFDAKKTYFIYFIDLCLLNCINLFISVYFGWLNTFVIIFTVILFFTFYRSKINQPIFKIPFKILDISTILQLRRYKLHYLVFGILYYVAYQGIIEENRNLYIGCILGIIIIMLTHQQKTEKLEYFILSRLSNKKYILKTEFDFMINCFILILPCLLFSISKPIWLLYGIICLSLISIVFPIKYIFLNNQITISFTFLLLIFYFVSIMMNTEIDLLMLSAVVPLSIILHLIAFRKFTKEKLIKNSDVYLN